MFFLEIFVFILFKWVVPEKKRKCQQNMWKPLKLTGWPSIWFITLTATNPNVPATVSTVALSISSFSLLLGTVCEYDYCIPSDTLSYSLKPKSDDPIWMNDYKKNRNATRKTAATNNSDVHRKWNFQWHLLWVQVHVWKLPWEEVLWLLPTDSQKSHWWGWIWRSFWI